MRALLINLLLLPLFIEMGHSQVTAAAGTPNCGGFSSTTPLPNIQLADTTEHADGSHYVSTGTQPPGSPIDSPGAVTGKCTYSSGAGANCDTSCSVALTGATTNVELGNLNASGTHMVGLGTASGSGAATNGGASCSAALGGAATNCLAVLGTCFVSVTVSVQGVSVSTNGHEVWKNSAPFSLNCGAMPDPTKTVAGGGGPVITDPCDNPSWAGLANDFSGPPPSGCFPSPIVIDTEGEGFHLMASPSTFAATAIRFKSLGLLRDHTMHSLHWIATGTAR
jgi:hypothetical protein